MAAAKLWSNTDLSASEKALLYQQWNETEHVQTDAISPDLSPLNHLLGVIADYDDKEIPISSLTRDYDKMWSVKMQPERPSSMIEELRGSWRLATASRGLFHSNSRSNDSN